VKVVPHSVAVHVSITTPVNGSGFGDNVDVAVPVMRQPPVRLFEYVRELVVGTAPHATVIFGVAVNVGVAAGDTVIVLDTGAIVRPHTSVAAHVSTIVPPQTPGVAVRVDVAAPVIRQVPDPLLL
jgi:hypothetical protein